MAENGGAGNSIAVIGAGLAGSEAAWQLARRGVSVDLYEMRPVRGTEAHQGPFCAELVCSNSFKSTAPENAHGLLKAELALQGSLMLRCAAECAVPAGQALAVDRELFAQSVTRHLEAEPAIRIRREEVTSLEALLAGHDLVLVATGPLTSSALADDLSRLLGSRHLAFYDAISPVVAAESIDPAGVFRASRYGKGDADYLNCPMTEAEYSAFVGAIAKAEKVPVHAFETVRPFEGCLPIEVMVERGPLTLAYGPMKPVGLTDPRSGRRPFAVVQLRQENRQASLYNLVGFQTKMTWPEQRRIFRMIPGLERAEFARLGSLHRNTFIESPRLLDADLAWRENPRLRFAGQITGVEGYMESAASGLYAGKRAAFALLGLDLPRPTPATMTGALLRYVTETPIADFQPMNSAFGLLDPAPAGLARQERKAYLVRRALEELRRLEALEPAREGLTRSA
jgi:methylenetetrahydrofolate--tRNA-(uracil-5-)-methyltransferase